MELNKTYITNKGRALMAKISAGTTTSFTKMAISSKEYPDSTVSSVFEELAVLPDVKQEAPIADVKIRDNVYIDIKASVSNKDLKAGYKVGCIGFYASDPDEGEVLYAVSPVKEGTGDWFPADNGLNASSLEVALTVLVGNSANVTMEVDSGAYATVSMLNEAIEEIINSPNYIRNSDFTNPVSQRNISRDYSSGLGENENDMYDLWYKTPHANIGYNSYLRVVGIWAMDNVEGVDTLASISQPIKKDYAAIISGKVVTVSCFVKRIAKKEDGAPYTWKMCLYNRDLTSEGKDKVFSDETKVIGQPLVLKEGLNVFQIKLEDLYSYEDMTRSNQTCGLGFAIYSDELSAMNVINILWPQLNLGRYSPYRAPDYSAELAFCRQYYYKLESNKLFLGVGRYKSNRLDLPSFRLPVPLIRDLWPTLKWEGITVDTAETYKITTLSLENKNTACDAIELTVIFKSDTRPSNTKEFLAADLSGYISFDVSYDY